MRGNKIDLTLTTVFQGKRDGRQPHPSLRAALHGIRQQVNCRAAETRDDPRLWIIHCRHKPEAGQAMTVFC